MAERIEVFALPDVGEGLTEGEILTWHVQPGDVVTVNQTIVEIETAKAAVELPCPFAGTVVEVHAAPGSVVPVGAPIISIRVEAKALEREAVLVGYGVKHEAPQRRPRKAAANGSAPHGAGSNGHRGDVKVKPLVRLSERETAAYCVVRSIDYIVDECPMAAGNRHLGYKAALDQLEAQSPGSKHSFYFGFLERAFSQFEPLAASDREDLEACTSCGAPTTAGECAFCRLVVRAGGRRPVPVTLGRTPEVSP